MKRLLPAATAIALAFAAAPALAQSSGQQGQMQTPQAQAPQTQTPAPRSESQSTNFTEAQLRAYAAAKADVDRLGQNRTEAQTAAVLQRHNIDATTYASIERAARTDRTLAQRIASLPSSGSRSQ